MANRWARLLASLTNSQFQKENNALYKVIADLIRGAQNFEDAFNSIGISTTGGGGGGAIPSPSNTVEDLDGTNDPGVSLEYSRGDHKHDYGVNSIDYNRIQQVSGGGKVLGRAVGAGAGDVTELDIETDLADHVVMSDGSIPPVPMDDGGANFIYVTYTP